MGEHDLVCQITHQIQMFLFLYQDTGFWYTKKSKNLYLENH